LRLVVIDLIPALLTWEGRDASALAADDAERCLDELFDHHRLAGVCDGDRTGAEVRAALNEAGLAGYFDSVGTSAGFGPRVSPRVVRRLGRGLHTDPAGMVVVTGRPPLHEALRRARIPSLLTEPGALAGVPAAVAAMESGLPIP
jgi:hypothetical protein